MIIENKVWTIEHSDQLNRYYQGVKKGHPNWRVFGIYLTPFGDTPSHEKYLPLDYTAVCNILDDVLEDTGLILISDVKISIQHYTEMVRRNIVGDSNIARLCQQIYQKHKRALDLIYEHRPDLEGDIRYTLTQLIKNSKGLAYLGRHRNEYIYFRSRQWEVSALDAGNDPHGFFRFVFHNHFEELFLFLETSPGDETTRRRLYEMGQKNESLFNDLLDPRTNDYPKLYRRIFLTPEHFEEAFDCEREREIRKQWDEFLGKDLPRIEEALKGEKWIWDPVEADG